jgi:ethanolamine transporter EutH
LTPVSTVDNLSAFTLVLIDFPAAHREARFSMHYADLRQPWILLIPLAIAAFAVGEIRAGRARFGRHLAFTRNEKPALFWSLILAKFAVAIFVVVMYFMNYTS